MDGVSCAYWDDVIAEIVAPIGIHDEVLVKLGNDVAARWDDIGLVLNEKYDDGHFVYYIRVISGLGIAALLSKNS